jgi:hypothetical protein
MRLSFDLAKSDLQVTSMYECKNWPYKERTVTADAPSRGLVLFSFNHFL